MTAILLAFIIDIRIHISIQRNPPKPVPVKSTPKQSESKYRPDPFVEFMREWDRDYWDAFYDGVR